MSFDVFTPVTLRSQKSCTCTCTCHEYEVTFGLYLVALHGRVDLLRPRVDAARHVVDGLEAGLQEVIRRTPAAPAVVAVEREHGVLRQRFDLRHRGVIEHRRAGDLRDLALLRRADVVDVLDRAGVDQTLELDRSDLADAGGAI